MTDMGRQSPSYAVATRTSHPATFDYALRFEVRRGKPECCPVGNAVCTPRTPRAAERPRWRVACFRRSPSRIEVRCTALPTDHKSWGLAFDR